jgi:hypothetical protein
MNDNSVEVDEHVDLLLLELRTLRAEGPHLQIIHRFRHPGSECAPGEEIVAVHLLNRAKEFLVPLSCTLLLMFDYLANHAHLPQSAAQITAGMKADPFYHRHGANAATHVRLTRKINRSSIKVYIERLRTALMQAFRNARIQIDPFSVLVSEQTLSNEVGYRLRAHFEWIHIDHPGLKLNGP